MLTFMYGHINVTKNIFLPTCTSTEQPSRNENKKTAIKLGHETKTWIVLIK